MNIQRVRLTDVLPNPYRHVSRYRLSDEKVDALVRSHEHSGFWDGSIQARPHPMKAGKVEIAFGHHRIEAAKRHGLDVVGLIVAPRSNADMLRMMADENREEFKGDHLVAIETIAATIDALTHGDIQLDAVEPNTPTAYVRLLPDGRSYTCTTLARFLGWTKADGHGDVEPTRAARLAFDAYHDRANIMPALQRLPDNERTPQTTRAVLAAVKHARACSRRAARSETETRDAEQRAARDAVKRIRDGAIASTVQSEAEKIGRKAARVEPTVPDISHFVVHRADGLAERILNLDLAIIRLGTDAEQYLHQIDDWARDRLLRVLTDGRDRLQKTFTIYIEGCSRIPVHDVTPRRRLLKASSE